MLFRNLGINEAEKSQDWQLALLVGGRGSGCFIENDTNLEFRAGRIGSLVIPSLELKQSPTKGEASFSIFTLLFCRVIVQVDDEGFHGIHKVQKSEIPLVYLASEFLLPVYRGPIRFVAEIGKRIVTHDPRGEG